MRLCGYCGGSCPEQTPAKGWPRSLFIGDYAFCDADCAAKKIAELEAALKEVLRTGLNGGNSLRLSFIAASRKALDKTDIARAEASERAVQRALASLKAQPGAGGE